MNFLKLRPEHLNNATYRRSENSVAKISILFKDDDFMFSKRTQVYSFTAFLANFGGILGLFLGVSVLSFIEIIFFLMFRQFSNNYKAS